MSEIGLKNGNAYPISGPSGISNVGCFHCVSDNCRVFSTLGSTPTTNVCPAPLSPLGYLLEQEGVVFILTQIVLYENKAGHCRGLQIHSLVLVSLLYGLTGNIFLFS